MPPEYTPDTVRAILAPHGISVRQLGADTSTASLAAEALGTSVGSIAKSLLFFDGDRPVLVIASGDTRVSATKLATVLGTESVRLAKPKEVLAVTGYAVGGVPPVAHASTLRVLMDRALLPYPIVYAAAGSPLAIFPIEPSTLCEIARAELVDIADRHSETY